MEYRIMSDNEVSKNKLSDNSDTEKKEAATLSPGTSTTKASATENDNAETKKAAISKSEPKRSAANTATKKPSPSNAKVVEDKPSNKTATIALVIATVSIFASIGHYLWQQQQSSAQLLTLNQQNQRAIEQGQSELKSSLTAEFNHQLQQQNRATSQSQENAKKAHSDSDTQLQRLTAHISQLEQKMSLRQPNDWLIHEAEYLVRVAARTMWLERDTKAAISLLRDADNRLKELNQPKFLPVRALINEDIESLALMPTLQNQDAILTLMALNKQVPTLMLAGVDLAEALDQTKEDLALSDNIGDWQENLAKTWHKFLNDFITVRRRTGMVEPLMAPDQQQHLKQNLSLKIQLVQWAASEQKEEIYQQTLLDIQQWLNEFFDMSLPVNERFYQSIEQLKQQTIYYDYPSDLRSLAAIKRLLQDTKRGVQPQKPEPEKTKVAPAKKQMIEPTSEAKDSPTSEEVSGGQL
jgi:uroporphyrin-3 C-methyltransferase